MALLRAPPALVGSIGAAASAGPWSSAVIRGPALNLPFAPKCPWLAYIPVLPGSCFLNFSGGAGGSLLEQCLTPTSLIGGRWGLLALAAGGWAGCHGARLVATAFCICGGGSPPAPPCLRGSQNQLRLSPPFLCRPAVHLGERAEGRFEGGLGEAAELLPERSRVPQQRGLLSPVQGTRVAGCRVARCPADRKGLLLCWLATPHAVAAERGLSGPGWGRVERAELQLLVMLAARGPARRPWSCLQGLVRAWCPLPRPQGPWLVLQAPALSPAAS